MRATDGVFVACCMLLLLLLVVHVDHGHAHGGRRRRRKTQQQVVDGDDDHMDTNDEQTTSSIDSHDFFLDLVHPLSNEQFFKRYYQHHVMHQQHSEAYLSRLVAADSWIAPLHEDPLAFLRTLPSSAFSQHAVSLRDNNATTIDMFSNTFADDPSTDSDQLLSQNLTKTVDRMLHHIKTHGASAVVRREDLLRMKMNQDEATSLLLEDSVTSNS